MIGLGRTGLPIAKNLLARGHAVIGYRRGDATEFTTASGRLARAPRDVAEAADVILSVLPSASALDDVMADLLPALGPRHTVVELSSYPLAVKQRYHGLLSERGAHFIDGEISGTPAMTAARASVILLAGDKSACEAVLAACKDASDHAVYVGAFGSATKLKLVANLLVAVHTVAAAEAMLLVEMWKQRAPSMAARRFVDPAPGPVSMLAAYLEPIRELADATGAPSPLFAVAEQLFRSALADGRAHQDIGCVIDLLDPAKPKKGPP